MKDDPEFELNICCGQGKREDYPYPCLGKPRVQFVGDDG